MASVEENGVASPANVLGWISPDDAQTLPRSGLEKLVESNQPRKFSVIKTKKFVRKPICVDGVRVTQENFEELAEWCEGQILTEESGNKQYIKVNVFSPKHPRQTQAFVGDWILNSERGGWRVYTNRSFQLYFDEAEKDTQKEKAA